MLLSASWAYTLTQDERDLVDNIATLVQNEEPAKATEITTTLLHALQVIEDERKRTIISQVLTKLWYEYAPWMIKESKHYESDIDFDALYADFLAQMRKENIQTTTMEIIKNIEKQPAAVDMDITVKSGDMDAQWSISAYIWPDQQAEMSIKASASKKSENQKGSLSVDLQTNKEKTYIKINEVNITDGVMPAELQSVLSLAQGKWISTDEKVIDYNYMIQSRWKILGNKDAAFAQKIITEDGVWLHDTSRKTTMTSVPVKLSPESKKEAGDHVDNEKYSFVIKNNQRYLEIIEDDIVANVGKDTLTMDMKDESAEGTIRISSPKKWHLNIHTDMKNKTGSEHFLIKMSYKPTIKKDITYPENAIKIEDFYTPTTEDKDNHNGEDAAEVVENAAKELPTMEIDAATVAQVTKDITVHGSDSAEILLIEYSDIECMFCQKQSKNEISEKLLKRFPSQVKTTFKNFPLQFHKEAQHNAEAIECAKDQANGKKVAWFISRLFRASDLTRTWTIATAKEAGLDSQAIKTCVESGQKKAIVANQIKEWEDVFNVSGTPTTILLHTTTGKYKVIYGTQPYEVFEKAVNDLLSE